MPDLAFHRSPPTGAERVVGAQVSLGPVTGGEIVQVLACSHDGNCGERLKSFAAAQKTVVRPLAPHQWMMVFPQALSREEMTRLEQAAGDAVLLDQTHGRARFVIEGPQVESVLCKGVALDLDIAAFPVGHSAVTLVGHISASLTRLDVKGFELLVLRGFAESLWDDLVQMSAEYVGHREQD